MSLMEMGIHGVVSVEVVPARKISTRSSVAEIIIKTESGQDFTLNLFADKAEFLAFKAAEA